MNVTTIKDTVKELAQSLRATTILPASLFVIAHLYLIRPALWGTFDRGASSVMLLAFGLTLVGSYVLYAFNFPLIRLLEGYKGKEMDLSQWSLGHQRRKWQRLREEVETLRKQRKLFINHLGFDPEQDAGRRLERDEAVYWRALRGRLAEAEYRFDRHYPSSYYAVLPTALGNTIAAFEDYAPTRYGMSTIALWPRLVPILKEKGFTDFVNQEKSVLDFLLNTFVVSAVLGLELMYLALYLCREEYAVAGVASFAIAALLYRGAIIAARQWGTTVRVAFDLYRHNLWHRLGLEPTGDFEQEYTQWQQVSRFLLFRQKGTWFQGFRSQEKMEEVFNLSEESQSEEG